MLPNFFIVGAAKSGTSSLCRYLEQHPEIYFPKIKEPSYFAFPELAVNHPGPGDAAFDKSVVTKLDDYERLFAGVGSEIAVGEGSVLYLYDQSAARNIHTKIPNSKIIIVIRNPVDRAMSAFMHLRRDGRETVEDFVSALDCEDMRRELGWQHMWHYRAMGFYYDSIKRFYSLFGPENVRVYKYEEMTKPGRMFQEIFCFLGVQHDFQPDISTRHNISGIPKSRSLHTAMMRNSFVKSVAKTLLPSIARGSIRNQLNQLNLIRGKPSISPTVRKLLLEGYREDIMKTAKLINKDLNDWLE